MTASPSSRARRPFWGDARFLLGIVLIAASVAGVWLVVTAARQTSPVLAAARTLVAGDVVSADDVRAVEVALGGAGEAYLAPDGLVPGAVATRTVGAGELLPADALGAAEDARVTTVVVDTAADVPADLSAGWQVELWHAPPAAEAGAFQAPRILVADATVARVVREEGVLGAGAAALELVIPRAEVAATLAALSDGSALSVVPVSGAAP